MTKDWRSDAGRKGALKRMELYGNPGTSEGRRLGGLRSIQTNTSKSSKFKTLIRIRIPKVSIELAELLGILMGDGHLGIYQVSVTTNSETDREHAWFIKALIEDMFGILVSLRYRKTCKAVVLVASSKATCDFLASMGMPVGNKLLKGLCPPKWILASRNFRIAFLRGLIDTDGCVYKDRHTIKEKTYSSTCIAFTSASGELLEFVRVTLIELGFTPTTSGKDIRLRRKSDVLGYRKIVGFSNPKHLNKIGI